MKNNFSLYDHSSLGVLSLGCEWDLRSVDGGKMGREFGLSYFGEDMWFRYLCFVIGEGANGLWDFKDGFLEGQAVLVLGYRPSLDLDG